MKAPYKPITVLDFIVMAALIAGAGALFPLVHSGMPQTVSVFRDNQMIARYPLDENRAFQVEGVLGPVAIDILKSSVKVSACPWHQQWYTEGKPRHICRSWYTFQNQLPQDCWLW